jgi:hypothetical protein
MAASASLLEHIKMQVPELYSSVREPSINTGFCVEYFQSTTSSTNETTGKCLSIVLTFIIMTTTGFYWSREREINYFQFHIFPMTNQSWRRPHWQHERGQSIRQYLHHHR